MDKALRAFILILGEQRRRRLMGFVVVEGTTETSFVAAFIAKNLARLVAIENII